MFGGATLGHPEIVYGRVRAGGSREPFDVPGAPLRVRVVDRADPSITKTARGYAEAELGARVRRRAISPPTWCGCSVVVVGPARRRRGARPHNRHAVLGPRRAGRRRHPVGHQRRGQRVRDAVRARVAAAAGGAGASRLARAGARGDDDVVPRLDRGARRGGRRRRLGGGPPPPARVGRGAAPARAGVADWRRSRWSSACPAASWRWSTASAA